MEQKKHHSNHSLKQIICMTFENYKMVLESNFSYDAHHTS